MSNNPFDRMIWNLREKPLSSDWNRALSQLDYSIRRVVNSMVGRRASDSSAAFAQASGFFGSDFRVVASSVPGMSVTVKAGLGFMGGGDQVSAIDSISGLDDLSTFKPLLLLADTVFAVPTAPGANSRIDVIEAKVRRDTIDPTSRLVLNPTTGSFDPATVDKTLTFSLDGSVGTVTDPALSTAALGYKTGIVGAVPVAPTVTPGYIKVAEVRVGTSVVSISNSDVGDYRKLLADGGTVVASARFQVPWNAGAPTINFLSPSLASPPGVQISARAIAGLRGQVEVLCAGGGFTVGTCQATIESPSVVLGGGTSVEVKVDTSTSTFSGPLSSTERTNFAAGTPAFLSAIGAQRVLLQLRSLLRDVTGAGSDTAAELENIIYNVTFRLGYS